MARLGVLDLVGLGLTLAISAPIALFGVEELLAGRQIGAVFLALAVSLVAIEQWLTTPGDLPGKLLDGVVGRVVVEDEEE